MISYNIDIYRNNGNLTCKSFYFSENPAFSQWEIKNDSLTPLHKWHSLELIPKTSILAKANALVHCGDMLAEQPQLVNKFAEWLNNVFECTDKSALGTLDRMDENKYDLILTNPPFVVSGSADFKKLMTPKTARTAYFSQKHSGIEGLFVQYIVKALKMNGEAWVLLPEAFFLRTPDESLRKWVIQNCTLDMIALLPERTFFNTPKRVVIIHLKKRLMMLSNTFVEDKKLDNEHTLLFVVGEIGETRDSKRFPIKENDLPLLIESYNEHSINKVPTNDRSVVISSKELVTKSFNMRHYWDTAIARRLGLLSS